MRQWLLKTHEDLETARYLVTDRIELGFAIGFHAQQAVEKSIKAVLVWHQIEFPKTHDIKRLAELFATVDSKLGALVHGASELSLYAVDARYPGDLPVPSPTEARDAVSLAERVCSALSAHLPPELRFGDGK